MDQPKSYLLPLTGVEITIVLDALVAFAVECEKDDDPCGVVPFADDIADRCRSIDDICSFGRELMKYHGAGRFKNRPQG